MDIIYFYFEKYILMWTIITMRIWNSETRQRLNISKNYVAKSATNRITEVQYYSIIHCFMRVELSILHLLPLFRLNIRFYVVLNVNIYQFFICSFSWLSKQWIIQRSSTLQVVHVISNYFGFALSYRESPNCIQGKLFNLNFLSSCNYLISRTMLWPLHF